MIEEIKLNERAYQEFMELIDVNEQQEAYKLFKKRPALTEFMRLSDITAIYAEIQRFVGAKEARLFGKYIAREFTKILKEEFSGADSLCDLLEEEDRKWLEEQFGQP